MGSIRTLLALAVLFTHAGGYSFVGGRLAVQLFYVISGFLISLVLTESKSYRSVKGFYINRILRLCPIYYVVAGATLVGLVVATTFTDVEFFRVYREVDAAGFFLLIFANIMVIGQDWVMFTAIHEGALHFSSNFRNTDVCVYKGLLVPQAWTLGLELSFYFIAPFVLQRRRYIIGLLGASLGIRAFLILQGIGLRDPWIYRFFPTELALFLCGSLSHQIWMPYLKGKKFLNEASAKGATAFVFVYCLTFSLLPFQALNNLLLVFTFVMSLPFLLHFQSYHKWDRAVGELSYPIYISHMAVIGAVSYFGGKVLLGHYLGACCAFLTVGVSTLLNKFIALPIEKARLRIKLADQ